MKPLRQGRCLTYPGNEYSPGCRKGVRVAKWSGVQRIKKEKRERRADVSPGVTRRSFLTFLGAGSAALAAGSAGLMSGPAGAQEGFSGAASTPYRNDSAGSFGRSFEPIEPTDPDELVLPEGFKFDIIRRWGEPVTADRDFGYNNDYVAYFPIDALRGGTNSEDGLLWVNHEYTNPKWVSDYTDPDNATKKTKEQVAKEKAAVAAPSSGCARRTAPGSSSMTRTTTAA